MDTAGVAMWADVCLGPSYVKTQLGGKAVLIRDSCGPHNVNAIKDNFTEMNVTPCHLPKNMTDVLQPIDLVVNTPLKSAIRRPRCSAVFEEFQRWKWKIKRLTELAKDPAAYALPPWTQPKTSLHTQTSLLSWKLKRHPWPLLSSASH